MVTVVDKMHLYYRRSLCADCLLPVVEGKWSLEASGHLSRFHCISYILVYGKNYIGKVRLKVDEPST